MIKLICKDGYGVFERGDSVYFTAKLKYYKYDLNRVIEISIKQFLLAKYGVKNKFWDKPYHQFGRLSNGNFTTIFYQENIFRVHSPDGSVIETIDEIRPRLNYGGVYGMTVDKNDKIWIVAPVEHYLGKFNLEGEQLFSITCDDMLEPTELDYPEHISSIGEFVYVSELGNRRIVKININNFKMEILNTVTEPIYYYSQLNGRNIYQFSSGLYVEQ